MSDIYRLLGNVQQELHAPKGQTNSFGGYKYRSAEDILEAVKPVLSKHGLTLVVSDEIVAIGDRVYVKATAVAVMQDGSGDGQVRASGWAREPLAKKGADESQITGAASSYARKYALNGLFAIDDSKDADTDEHRRQVDGAPKSKPAPAGKPAASKAAASTVELIKAAMAVKGLSKDDVDAHVAAKHGGSLADFLGNEAVLTQVLDWIKL